MNKFVLGAICALALVGCNQSIEGNLILTSPLSMNTDKGQQAIIMPGEWTGKVSIDGKGSKLSLEAKVPGGAKTKVTLKSSTQIPTRGGEFELKAADIGQEWSVDGVITMGTLIGPQISDREYCGNNVAGPGYDGGAYPRNGWRNVIYHGETTTTTVELTFDDEVRGMKLGTFAGQQEETMRVYDIVGSCW